MLYKAILGLGNTGSKYKNTYHNIGQLMADFLLENNIFPENVIIANNEGFMNESGNSALKLLNKIGGQPEKLLVIHDDSDIELGKYKLSIDRSSAGHKGIEDIINKIGSKNFWRLRIGIRPTGEETTGRMKAEEFVLRKIKKEDLEILRVVFEEAASKFLISN